MPLFRAAATQPQSNESPAASLCLWFAIRGYLAELVVDAASEDVRLNLRDSRYGLQLASAVATPSGSRGAKRRETKAQIQKSSEPFVVTWEDVSVVAGIGGSTFALDWELPQFSLQMVVGSVVPPTGGTIAIGGCREELAPLREAVVGKRPREDASVQALFSSKRRATTEAAWSAELRGRRWQLSAELIDAVIDNGSWPAARALLALPELDEAHAVRLLAARPELLTRVVRRSRAPEKLGVALRNHLPASQLKGVLEVLQLWLDTYLEFPEDDLRNAAPDLPRPPEIVQFLSSLSEGCLSSLARLDVGLVEQIIDSLSRLQGDTIRTEKMYGALRAAWRSKPARRDTAASAKATVEAMLLPL
jgi:hypothetical protein